MPLERSGGKLWCSQPVESLTPLPRPLSLQGGLRGAVHLAQELPGGRVTIKEALGWESGVKARVRPSDWVVWPCVNHSLYRLYCLHGEVEMLVNNWLSDVTELLGERNKKRKYKAVYQKEYYVIHPNFTISIRSLYNTHSQGNSVSKLYSIQHKSPQRRNRLERTEPASGNSQEEFLGSTQPLHFLTSPQWLQQLRTCRFYTKPFGHKLWASKCKIRKQVTLVINLHYLSQFIRKWKTPVVSEMDKQYGVNTYKGIIYIRGKERHCDVFYVCRPWKYQAKGDKLETEGPMLDYCTQMEHLEEVSSQREKVE